MSKAKNWMNATTAHFAAHPEHEFRLTTIPLSAVRDVAASGWIAGAASRPQADGMFLPQSSFEDAALICVVCAPGRGTPQPGVFLLDGVPPTLPPVLDARSEEAFCAVIWGLAQVAAARGVPLVTLMPDPSFLALAITATTHKGPARAKPSA